MIELLSPVGDFECLKAAVQNGADAVYFGANLFSARAFAYNFDGEEVYNENGIRILAAPNPNFSASSPLILFIENSSDCTVMIDYEDLAYNNTMISELQTGPFVLPHSYRLEKMNIFFFSDEPQIDTVEKVTLKFSILPIRSDGSFSTGDIIDTAPITINYK